LVFSENGNYWELAPENYKFKKYIYFKNQRSMITREEILAQVNTIFRNVLENDKLIIKEETTRG